MTSKNYHEVMINRLEKVHQTFFKKYKNVKNEDDYLGLYSLLRLANSPTDDIIRESIDNYLQFIQKEYDVEDKINLKNEKYFQKVFNSLLNTKNHEILTKMLKVIEFYINLDESPYQLDIIKPDTILWMLEIMENQRNNKYLCCLTSATLLNIVNKHEIHFNY